MDTSIKFHHIQHDCSSLITEIDHLKSSCVVAFKQHRGVRLIKIQHIKFEMKIKLFV